MIGTLMHVSAWPESITIEHGGSGLVSVMVTNTSRVIDAYTVELLGIDPSWTTPAIERFSLFPGESQQVDITITMPRDTPSAEHLVTAMVRAESDPSRFEFAEITLIVAAATITAAHLDPALVTGGRVAHFGLVVENSGNSPVEAEAYATDPEDLARFEIEPPVVVVDPGERQVVEVSARGGRSWFGQPRARTFNIGVRAERDVETVATFIQRPRISRWLIALLGLLTAAAVFALVLSRTIDRVVSDASVSDAVINQALDNNPTTGARIPDKPGTVTGVLTTTTRSQLDASTPAAFQADPTNVDVIGVAAVQVELYFADDPRAPIATAASDRSGRFTLSNLQRVDAEDKPVKYFLQFSGAGYPNVWYAQGTPGVPGTADATAVAITGDRTDLGEIQIGGIPVTVQGKVAGDAAGATIQLIRPGQVVSGTDAVLAETTVAPDGSFTLPDIPSPADVILVVQKPGFSTVRRAVTIQPGDTLGDINIVLPPAEGNVTGHVTDSVTGAALGGVDVSATDGTNVIETVSYTIGEKGRYQLRNLTTPGQYSITFTMAHYRPTTISVTLTAGQTAPLVNDVTLVPADGVITGTATLEGEPSGSIEIRVTGSTDQVRVAYPVSDDAAGSFTIAGLEVPDTYTLTFTGDGILPEVRVVTLEEGATTTPSVNVDLRRALRVVSGVVVDESGAGFSGAEVVLTDGTEERLVLSADEQWTVDGGRAVRPGVFAFSDVPAGTYTLRASRQGTLATVIPVVVGPGQDSLSNVLRLAPLASITGTVQTDRVCTSGERFVAQLFPADQFGNDPVDEVELTFDGTVATFRFDGVDAPVTYLIGIATESSSTPLATTSVVSQLSQVVNIDQPLSVKCTGAA